jgi:transposase
MHALSSRASLKERLVVGFGRSGKRRRFDSQAKRELVEACLQPGVSIARLAIEHGVNANLLRKWIRQHQQEQGDRVATDVAGSAMPAFVSVVAVNPVDSVELKPEHSTRLSAHATGCGFRSESGSRSLRSAQDFMDRVRQWGRRDDWHRHECGFAMQRTSRITARCTGL